MTTPSQEATKLQQILAKLQQDMANLKAGAAAPQLDNSSIEASVGRGYIPILQNGTVKHLIGRQPDGTFASISKNNTSPPVVPNTPSCTPGLASITVFCDGFGSRQFADFSHINVYCDGVCVGTIMKVPESFVVSPLTYGPHVFQLSAVNLSETESAKTASVTATPSQVVGDDVAQGIVTDLQLADAAVTAAKVATGAITSVAIANGAIQTVNINNAAITNALIAANAIQTSNIASGAVTNTQLAANSVASLQIAANAVTSAAIAAGAVQTAAIATGAITATQIATNTIVATNIAAGAITSTQMAANSITAVQLAASSVLAGSIAAGAVTASAIQANAVTANALAANAVTAASIAAGTITATQLAADSVTTTQLAANSVTSAAIVAGTILASDIASGTITAAQLTAGTITSDRLAANSVTALQIAANAITASAITAGSIDATKFSAQLILASQAIICGSTTGKRIALDAGLGLYQTDAQGNLALQLGTDPAGNSLTVIDPSDPTNALASIGADGSVTMSGISINGTASINGVDLIDFLNSVPQGVISQGSATGNSPSTTSTVGWFEISADIIGNREYQLLTDPVYCYNNTVTLVARYTIDGSTPTVSSPILSQAQGLAFFNGSANTGAQSNNHTHGYDAGGGGGSGVTSSEGYYVNDTGMYHTHGYIPTTYPTSIQINAMFSFASNCRIRILFTIYNGYSTSCYVAAANNLSNVCHMTLIDQGTKTTPTGGTSSGGGTTNAIGQYVATFAPTYCSYYGDTTGNTGSHSGLQQGKVGSVNWMSMLGFNYANIVSVLTGATIVKVELYLYSDYWALSSGGECCVGTHNTTGSTAPSAYSYVSRDLLDQPMKKPQGLWLQLPVSIGTAFKGGTIKGLVLDSRSTFPATTNYGTFRDTTYTDTTVQPSLRITYTK